MGNWPTLLLIFVAVVGFAILARQFTRRMVSKTDADRPWAERQSAWKGEVSSRRRSTIELSGGATLELESSASIYEDAPILWSIHNRYFVPRTEACSEDWRDELVAAPFLVSYPIFLDIVYKRELPGRRIEVRGILLGYQGFYFDAFCFQRNGTRLFRVDSVTALIDEAGTKFMSVDHWIATLPLSELGGP
jgi:hypothetical protein